MCPWKNCENWGAFGTVRGKNIGASFPRTNTIIHYCFSVLSSAKSHRATNIKVKPTQKLYTVIAISHRIWWPAMNSTWQDVARQSPHDHDPAGNLLAPTNRGQFNGFRPHHHVMTGSAAGRQNWVNYPTPVRETTNNLMRCPNQTNDAPNRIYQ